MPATLLVLAGLLALTQQDPSSDPSAAGQSIVVEGRRDAPERVVRQMAQAVTEPLAFDRPMARFAAPVCFGVTGLSPEQNQVVANRMLDNAVAAGAPVSREGCEANVVVVFTKDGDATVRELQRTRSWLLRGSEPRDHVQLLRETGPVRRLSSVELRSGDGDRINQTVGSDDPLSLPRLKTQSPSRVTLSTRRDLTTSVLLIDLPAIVGKSLDQLADYATMRTLALTEPAEAGADDTILALFDANRPAHALTRFDRAYLAGLYDGEANQRAPVMVSRMVKRFSADADARVPR